MDISEIEEVNLKKEQDLARWCPENGKNTGQIILVPGSDEWYMECPEFGTRWAGGSTMLTNHVRWR